MRKKLFWLIVVLSIFIQLEPSNQYQVVEVVGDTIKINVGSERGVENGFSGKVYYYYKNMQTGVKEQINIAGFRVEGVEKSSCRARVFNKKQDVESGFWVSFDQDLREKTVEKQAMKPDSSKQEQVARPVAKKRDSAADQKMELVFWDSIKDSSNPDDYRAYLNKFPNGIFAELAHNRINENEQKKSEQAEKLKREEEEQKRREELKKREMASRTWLRSDYQSLSVGEVKSMLSRKGFYDKSWHKSKTFRNQFERKYISGDEVVLDHSTGLMWQQGGSSKSMRLKMATQWVEDLNRRGYAGYRDWRLPTLEEAVSLLESSKMNGDLYIDPVFSKTQSHIWTGDRGGSPSWIVYFSLGIVNRSRIDRSRYYVRVVRSLQQTDIIDSNHLNTDQESRKQEEDGLNEEPVRVFNTQMCLIRRVEPVYPDVALRARIQGKVICEVATDVFGRVKTARIVSGHPVLNESALNALMQWVYEPYILNGIPKPVRFTVVIAFDLPKTGTVL